MSFSNINEVWGKNLLNQTKAPDNNVLNGYVSQAQTERPNIKPGNIIKTPISQPQSQQYGSRGNQISFSETSIGGPDLETENYDPHFSPYMELPRESTSNPKSVLKKKNVSLSDSSMSIFSDTNTSDTMDTLSDFDVSDDKPNECKKTISHVKKCVKCNHKLKKLINKRVKNKCDDVIFEYHKKFNYNSQPNVQPPASFAPMNPPVIQQPFPTNPPKDTSESLKETALLVVGGIIALIIIYFIARVFK